MNDVVIAEQQCVGKIIREADGTCKRIVRLRQWWDGEAMDDRKRHYFVFEPYALHPGDVIELDMMG